MRTIREIEDAVRKLSPKEFAALRDWFAEFDAAEWDRQFERDAAEGRLDGIADESRRERGSDPDPVTPGAR